MLVVVSAAKFVSAEGVAIPLHMALADDLHKPFLGRVPARGTTELVVWPSNRGFHEDYWDSANHPFGKGIVGKREEVLERIRGDQGKSFVVMIPFRTDAEEFSCELRFTVVAPGARKVWYG